MGHKSNPKILRIGITTDWNSRWFAAGKNYSRFLSQDVRVRKYLLKKLREAAVDKIEIDRSAGALDITIHTARPGVIIGRGGAQADEIREYIKKEIIRDNKIKVQVNIKEINKPSLSARIVAQNIALELEKRIPFRRAMKKYMEQAMKGGAQGIKVTVSGRLGGADIARTESLAEGKIPLHTLRADIDYSRLAATTAYGQIGVKVWICRGEVFGAKEQKEF